MEIFFIQMLYIYIYKYINIINTIYILYMTALLLTFAVRRLFDCFLFNFYFSLPCEMTPASHFQFSLTPHSVPV